jgi:formylglycine-generating enzyme required for sulfatase activity
MHGNVSEWCLGRGEIYSDADVVDQTVPGGISRVIRGGAWLFGPEFCRSAFRLECLHDTQEYCIGFRVALTFPFDFLHLAIHE